MAATLKEWTGESLCIITSDGRVILGVLEGYDQVQNLILKDAKERIYSDEAEVELVDLGLYVIRGDTVCMVGDYDDAKWTSDPHDPLPPLQQKQPM
mmetsp:Transcript_18481/g.51380  ORF Transcript_18481/g.51380 Transcript_18481/m.51380 type:complete len:96 (-) Transcript_18481:630-917(-)|eukprot:CAMPEP_0198116444 /NCGR_PEP_ID=MMETSP1442-20131203/12380_1 /TAXON_ID= /ORGANISM="Craspedostauros australis, Strain CCMP3328" /LENGTH=95 /DNA_ID=CAMNT_0043774263 /DNA_START=204 /DNA_END=491 /DNA_ORIENTATION=+